MLLFFFLSSSSAANKGVRNGDASAKATIDLKSIAKNAALKKEKLSSCVKTLQRPIETTSGSGDVWPVWSQHNRMHCQTGLSALLNDLQDDASSSDNDDDHNMRGGAEAAATAAVPDIGREVTAAAPAAATTVVTAAMTTTGSTPRPTSFDTRPSYTLRVRGVRAELLGF